MAKSLVAKLLTVEAALAELRTAIAKNKSPEFRAMRVKLEMYERVLQGFQYRTPGEEQYRSLHECVMELHEQVFGKQARTTFERRSPAPELPPSKRPTAVVPEPSPEKGKPRQ